MRRASSLTAAAAAAAGGLLLATTAVAQSPGSPSNTPASQRYLYWDGRSEPAPATVASNQSQPVRTDLRRPNPVIPHGGFSAAAPPAHRGLTPAPGPARRSLTPANAWLQPPPAPAPQPAPIAAAPVAAVPVAAASAMPVPQPRPTPEYLPDQGGRGQPTPVETVAWSPPPPPPEATPDTSAVADPMAPRRDAPIFRMARPATPQPSAPPVAELAAPSGPATPAQPQPQPQRVAQITNSGEAAPRQGARYYSVHRQNGRDPDALDMPASTYVDALVITGVESLDTQDLAEPEQGPTLIRDRNGNIRSAPAASDGDHR